MTIDENALKILIQEAYAEGYETAIKKTRPMGAWLKISEAAKIINVSPDTLRRHVYEGRLDNPMPHRPSKNGSNIMLHIKSLKTYMK